MRRRYSPVVRRTYVLGGPVGLMNASSQRQSKAFWKERRQQRHPAVPAEDRHRLPHADGSALQGFDPVLLGDYEVTTEGDQALQGRHGHRSGRRRPSVS